MNLFYDFYRSSIATVPKDASPRDEGRDHDAQFRSIVPLGKLRLWSPGDPVPSEGNRLLIGVATWSPYDMKLLDAVSETRPPHLLVDVFTVTDFVSPGSFEPYVPGIANVFHTPVVGLWFNGRLVEKASGKAGRELVTRVCGLDLSDVERPLSTRER